MVFNTPTFKKTKGIKMEYQINQEVWVKCAGNDCWVTGIVTGLTAKRVRVYNEVRSLEGLYAPSNVKAK